MTEDVTGKYVVAIQELRRLDYYEYSYNGKTTTVAWSACEKPIVVKNMGKTRWNERFCNSCVDVARGVMATCSSHRKVLGVILDNLRSPTGTAGNEESKESRRENIQPIPQCGGEMESLSNEFDNEDSSVHTRSSTRSGASHHLGSVQELSESSDDAASVTSGASRRAKAPRTATDEGRRHKDQSARDYPHKPTSDSTGMGGGAPYNLPEEGGGGRAFSGVGMGGGSELENMLSKLMTELRFHRAREREYARDRLSWVTKEVGLLNQISEVLNICEERNIEIESLKTQLTRTGGVSTEEFNRVVQQLESLRRENEGHVRNLERLEEEKEEDVREVEELNKRFQAQCVLKSRKKEAVEAQFKRCNISISSLL